MKHCDFTDRHPDRCMDDGQRAAFEAHLEGCAECRKTAARWSNYTAALAASEARPGPVEPSPARIAALIERAAGGRRRRVAARRALVLVPIGCALAVAGVLVLVSSAPEPPPEKDRRDSVKILAKLFVNGEAEPTRLSPRTSEVLEAPEEARLLAEIGRDRVGLAAGGRLRVLSGAPEQRRLRLEQGALACQVAPRRSGEVFEVAAGRFVVRVLGTRFLIEQRTKGSLLVIVDRGRVEVTRDSVTIGRVEAGGYLRIGTDGEAVSGRVEAGELKVLDRLLSAEAASDEKPEAARGPDAGSSVDPGLGRRDDKASGASASPRRPVKGDMKRWRTWVIQGRYGDAEEALGAHLRRAPRDSAAWSLIADCRRKAKRWGGAVDAYQKVIALAGSAEADRARFISATILQDRLGRHKEAAALLERYLEKRGSGAALRAEAMVRLARSFIELDRKRRARELLQKVVSEYGGYTISTKARGMLKGLDGP